MYKGNGHTKHNTMKGETSWNTQVKEHPIPH